MSSNDTVDKSPSKRRFKSFKEFYPFYLSQHENRTCRRLHFAGTSLVIVTLLYSVSNRKLKLLLACPCFGYGFAWIGHAFFEKNKPATFKYPIYSFMGDWVMYYDILRGKVAVV
jgi:hypothetical protein